MTEMLLNWIADTFARSDIVDLYFVVSDLFDIEISEAEICETAYFDAMASSQTQEYQTQGRNVPNGKTVY